LIEFSTKVTLKTITCGFYHTLALTGKIIQYFTIKNETFSFYYYFVDDGILYSWGDNYYGQLGSETATEYIKQNQPVMISTLNECGLKVIGMCCGSEHNLAMTSDNSIWSWGLNRHRQSGIDNSTIFKIPRRIVFFEGHEFHQIICGGCHNCQVITGNLINISLITNNL